MARFPKPAEGSWTEHYPELGTAPVSYEDSISPEFYERERKAVFKRAWLNVGRVEQLPRVGSYFTKELAVVNASVIVVKGKDGDGPGVPQHLSPPRQQARVERLPRARRPQAICRQFACKYHGWRYDLEGALTFVQQESEFFDLDKDDYGLAPVHCEVWAGFIFVNVAARTASRRCASSSARW